MSMLSEVKSIDEVDDYIDNKIKNKEKLWALDTVYIKMAIQEQNT